MTGVTHRAHKPDLLLLKSNQAVDLWVTPERHRNLPTNFPEEANIYCSTRGWLTAAVHTSIAWPKHDVMVHYDGDDYFLRGIEQGGDYRASPCLTMRWSEQEMHKILNKLYRFSSVLGWYKGGCFDVTGYITGSGPTLYISGKQPYGLVIAGGPNGFDCNYMPVVQDDNTRRALAFWREGLRLAHIHDGCSFLGFYKVIESQFVRGKDKGNWINEAITTLTGKAGERVSELQSQHIDAGKHIVESGRCAVAHASLDSELVDPDIPEDRIRIAKDLVIIEELAKKYIHEELQVPSDIDVYRYRDRLEALYPYLNPEHVEELKQGGSVLRKRIDIDGLHVSVNCWAHKPPESFTGLIVSVESAHNGILVLLAENHERTLALVFMFNFRDGKAHTNIERGGAVPPESGGNVEDSIAVLEYHRAVIGNPVIEITLPKGEKIQCEVVIPVNVDGHATFQAIDAKIAELRALNTENLADDGQD